MIENIEIDRANEQIIDLEWGGNINRSLAEGKKFALLLAMLEDNVLSRPSIDRIKDEANSSLTSFRNYYRTAPLSASKGDWLAANHCSSLMQQSSMDGLLWCAMHPQPLSLYNDTGRIDDEVVANCSVRIQSQIKGTISQKITPDPTKLYDILQNVS